MPQMVPGGEPARHGYRHHIARFVQDPAWPGWYYSASRERWALHLQRRLGAGGHTDVLCGYETLPVVQQPPGAEPLQLHLPTIFNPPYGCGRTAYARHVQPPQLLHSGHRRPGTGLNRLKSGEASLPYFQNVISCLGCQPTGTV